MNLKTICAGMALALTMIAPLRADPLADRKAAVESALDQYMSAKTEDQRTAVIDFLQHFDRRLVASALIDHIVDASTGPEATAYDKLIEALGTDGAELLLDRLTIETDATAKGKLIVGLRRCAGPPVTSALATCLDDTRPVPFASHTAHPRRVCDLAYDELFLKLRNDPRYHLDPGPDMKGVILESTPERNRDILIAKLKQSLAAIPAATPTPSPNASPEDTPTISGT